MNRTGHWRRILFALVMAVMSLCILTAAAEGLQQDVLVLFTSDVHCGMDQGFTFAGLKAMKDAAESAGNHVLLVDDGDAVQGESIGVITRGMAAVELMNAVGYDVAIPGNHEFDYGTDRFLELAEKAEFPYISCNFRKEGTRVLEPYVIREFDGVRIAFVGATTPETLTSSTPKYFKDKNGKFIYDFTQGGNGEEFFSAVQQAVNDARADGADYVFLLAHLGNEASCRPYTYADVVEHTTGIDAVLDGHSHDTDKVVMKNKDGDSVVRQACGTKMACVGWLRISAADGSVDTGLYKWDNDVTAPELLGIKNEMNEALEKVAGEVRDQLSEVVAVSSVTLYIDDPTAKEESGRPIRLIRRAETNMGDFCADIFRNTCGTDIALVNGGGIRTGLSAGDVTKDALLSVYPFGNPIMTAEATGQQILDALEWGARSVPEESAGFLHVSGLTYEIHTYIESTCTKDGDGLFSGVAGKRRVKNVMIGGEPLDPEKTYTVTGSSYLLEDHGDGQTAFDGATILQESAGTDFELMVDYIRGPLGGVIGPEYENPYGQERIVAVEAAPEK